MIIAVISAISFVLGATVAYVANGYPEYLPAIGTVAGILLIGGLTFAVDNRAARVALKRLRERASIVEQ
jgi:hypothetical protein